MHYEVFTSCNASFLGLGAQVSGTWYLASGIQNHQNKSLQSMKYLTIISVILLLFPHDAEAQLFKKKYVSNSNTLRTGPYYEYWDKDSVYLSAKGHFCNDSPCKTWKYYWKDGTRRMKVKYRDTLKIKYYRESGRLDQKGYAILDLDSKMIHFYWQGIWKFYDKKRRLYRKALFENGNEVMVLYGPEDPIYYE